MLSDAIIQVGQKGNLFEQHAFTGADAVGGKTISFWAELYQSQPLDFFQPRSTPARDKSGVAFTPNRYFLSRDFITDLLSRGVRVFKQETSRITTPP